MFAIESLPAGRGDCILLEYGEAERSHKVLIDGGPKPCYPALRDRILAMPQESRYFDLLVITHIDADHIESILQLLRERVDLGVRFGDVWFNGFQHLPAPGDKLGPVQGEQLTSLLEAHHVPWNLAFDGAAVVVPDSGDLPIHTLSGGLRLTLLSPTRELLARLWPKWEEAIERAGLTSSAEGQPEEETSTGHEVLGPGLDIEALAALPFQLDRSEANGSSIAFLAEFEGKRCLLAGDAFPRILAESLRRLGAKRDGPLSVEAFKPSHHGSRRSLDCNLIQLLGCKHYLISTDGSYFCHPHRETIARIIKHGRHPRLGFNYRTEFNAEWDEPELMREHGYEVIFPRPATTGLKLDL
jgi:beta-lactamase superfamily II metal-dependent hydrolase